MFLCIYTHIYTNYIRNTKLTRGITNAQRELVFSMKLTTGEEGGWEEWEETPGERR